MNRKNEEKMNDLKEISQYMNFIKMNFKDFKKCISEIKNFINELNLNRDDYTKFNDNHKTLLKSLKETQFLSKIINN